MMNGYSGKNAKGDIMPSESPYGDPAQTPVVPGKQIGIRLLYTILFLFILGIVVIIAKVVVVFQFIYLFSTGKANESVRQFSNKISTYGYRVLRYITLNENRRPFPFTDLSPELEPSEPQITFD